jgi:hypothetical protein
MLALAFLAPTFFSKRSYQLRQAQELQLFPRTPEEFEVRTAHSVAPESSFYLIAQNPAQEVLEQVYATIEVNFTGSNSKTLSIRCAPRNFILCSLAYSKFQPLQNSVAAIDIRISATKESFLEFIAFFQPPRQLALDGEVSINVPDTEIAVVSHELNWSNIDKALRIDV